MLTRQKSWSTAKATIVKSPNTLIWRGNYLAFQLKSSKGLVVVAIKAIEPKLNSIEISKALSEEGFKIKSVYKIKNRLRIPQHVFKVELQPEVKKLSKGETHPIYSLRYLLE